LFCVQMLLIFSTITANFSALEYILLRCLTSFVVVELRVMTLKHRGLKLHKRIKLLSK